MPLALTDNAVTVLERRYLMRDGDGKSVESPDDLFRRVAMSIAAADEAYAVANGTAYGLTAGVFSRSPETIEEAARALEAGNVYVNRKTTGARVGVEPFGGMRMSGTGPKAGGLDYLWAFVRRTDAQRRTHRARGLGCGSRRDLARRSQRYRAAGYERRGRDNRRLR